MDEFSKMDIKNRAAEIIGAVADKSSRYLVAVAGPPASGKSTLAEKLVTKINALAGQELSVVVPMDGFHLDNTVLEQQGMLHRKGAPETFDGDGFVELVKHLANTDKDVAIPGFDRSLDAVVAGAQRVKAEQRILVLEGNYLLLDHQPWCSVHDLYDEMIFLSPGLKVLETRLIDRWLKHGLDESAARLRAESNDLPNARYVLGHSVKIG